MPRLVERLAELSSATILCLHLIRNTWRLQPFQIVGGPDWINKDRWDITAKAPEGTLAPRDIC